MQHAPGARLDEGGRIQGHVGRAYVNHRFMDSHQGGKSPILLDTQPAAGGLNVGDDLVSDFYVFHIFANFNDNP
jgi:hypothetical protein